MPRATVLLLCCCGFLAGCASHDIRVTAYLSQDLPFPTAGSETRVGVVTKSSPEEPLLEAEVRRKIEWLLRQRGFEVGPLEESDYLLTAFFAIDSGKTAIEAYPVYEPGRTITSHYRTCRGRWVTRTTFLPGSTTYEPYRYTYFTRHLALTVYERQRWEEAGERDLAEVTVWRARAISRGPSADLRRIIDYLLVAAFEYFGEDTGRQVRETLRDGDQRAKTLRESYREDGP